MKLRSKRSTANELSITKKVGGKLQWQYKQNTRQIHPLGRLNDSHFTNTTYTLHTQISSQKQTNPDLTIVSAGRITCFLRGGHSQEYLLPPGMPSSPHGAVCIQGLLPMLGVVVTETAPDRTVCEWVTWMCQNGDTAFSEHKGHCLGSAECCAHARQALSVRKVKLALWQKFMHGCKQHWGSQTGLAALYSLLFPVLINFQFYLQQYINQNILKTHTQ